MSSKLSAITPSVPIGKDAIYRADNSTGTPASAASYVTDAAAIGSEQGVIVNGYITASVSSSNLTVALKAAGGTNASSSNPVCIKIGTSIRRITSSLSVTLNAGTNYFGGNGITSTLARQYFVYLTWVSGSSTVSLGIAAYPYFRTYADGSSTSTAEKYFPNSTTPASSDVCVNVGRFTATLSGSAAYTWSISGTGDVINNPVYETDWMTYTPTWASSGTQPAIGNGTSVGSYMIRGRNCSIKLRIQAGTTTTFGTGTYTVSIPFTAAAATGNNNPGFISLFDNSAGTLYVGSFNLSNGATSASLFTHGATGMTATNPITLANSDAITANNEYNLVVP